MELRTSLGRVLVVDDEPTVVTTVCAMLTLLGYEASAATSGEQAIAAMATVRPHVVLLDLMMPGISGVGALTFFGQHYRAVPVIVITGNIDDKMARLARAGGAFAVVEKPIGLNDLKGLVAQAMTPGRRE